MVVKFERKTLPFRWDFTTHPAENTFKQSNDRVVDYLSGVLESYPLPGWKQKIARSESATTTFHAAKYTTRIRNSRVTHDDYRNIGGNIIHDSTTTFHGVALPSGISGQLVPPVPAFVGSDYERAHNLATSRLFESIRDIESPANVGETLGETGETVKLLVRPARGLQDLTKYVMDNHTSLLKKARWNNYRRIGKSLADLVLEYRFGVKPLIEDLRKVSETLPFKDLNKPTLIPIKASGRFESVVASAPFDYKLVAGSINGPNIRYDQVTYFKVRYKGMYKIDPGIDHTSYQQSLGLTWREAFPTMVNLIPYSFLLDYVSNLSDVAGQIAVPWNSIAWCVKTSRAYNARTFILEGVTRQSAFPPAFFIEKYDRLGFYSVQANSVLRQDVTELRPFISLEWQEPSLRQLSNVGALLLGRLPVIGNIAAAARKRVPQLDPYVRTLLIRGSMQKVPYPYHR